MPNWNYSFLKGAGGIVSSAVDLVKWHVGFSRFLSKNPEVQKVLFNKSEEIHYRYGWFALGEGLIAHGGETPGFCSYIVVSQSGGLGAYTLNTDICLTGSLFSAARFLDQAVLKL